MNKYTQAERHIYNAIDSDGFEGCDYFNACSTDAEKAEFSYKRFISEYGWHVKQVGMMKAVENWLAGLALNIDFCNYDILKNAVAWGNLPENASETTQDNYCNRYFKFMAMRLISIWRKHGIKGL
jgi:hypothetical protein